MYPFPIRQCFHHVFCGGLSILLVCNNTFLNCILHAYVTQYKGTSCQPGYAVIKIVCRKCVSLDSLLDFAIFFSKVARQGVQGVLFVAMGHILLLLIIIINESFLIIFVLILFSDGTSVPVELEGSPLEVHHQPPGVLWAMNCGGPVYEACNNVVFADQQSLFEMNPERGKRF